MFKEAKATAMACFFLERAPGKKLNDLKLMKLLYIADRRAMKLHGAPISFDRFVSMRHGPVLSTTLRLMRDEIHGPVWDKHVGSMARYAEGSEQMVKLERAVDFEQVLSKAEIDVLQYVWDRFGHLAKWKLVDYCHKHFAEYDERAKKLNTSIDLEYETIFAALGDSAELAKEKAEDLKYYASLDDHGQPSSRRVSV